MNVGMSFGQLVEEGYSPVVEIDQVIIIEGRTNVESVQRTPRDPISRCTDVDSGTRETIDISAGEVLLVRQNCCVGLRIFAYNLQFQFRPESNHINRNLLLAIQLHAASLPVRQVFISTGKPSRSLRCAQGRLFRARVRAPIFGPSWPRSPSR